ncbi:MAG: DEAD/DEAH box helicase family protein [Muribaculaceae bacterium]|nr:DEAD/DEAH box helicase family protein [Muribaculaceae bacterium]
MKFKFKIQQYQTDAVDNTVAVFNGQPSHDSAMLYRRDLGHKKGYYSGIHDEEESAGYRNHEVELSSKQLLDNINAVQVTSLITPSKTLAVGNGAVTLDIEMETGTGKTYVYIKTMFELNRRFGWSKFIIVVPSIAIREGVAKSFNMLEEHFMQLYGKKARWFIYNSSNLQQLDQFSSDAGLNAMIINTQAFAASLNADKNKEGRGGDSAARIIYSKRDEFQSRRPIDVIAANRPIIIMDEPQKMEGAATQAALKRFNPLFTLNYSATHKTKHDTIYALDALDAYRQRLVKRIHVKGFEVKNLRGTSGYLYLDSVELSPNKPPIAKIELEIKTASGAITRKTKKFNVGDDLKVESGGLAEYDGYTVSEISPKGYVVFVNGTTIHRGQVIGDNSEQTMQRVQIRETIRSHFDKERQLFKRGIKCLSLFFIDEVSHYRQYDEDGNEVKGIFQTIFEEEYQRLVQEQFQIFDKAYNEYLMAHHASEVHRGYFSIDKKGRSVNSHIGRGSDISDDISAYDLILKNKERLLSFDEPTRFIFSHSALREGWDNPNVFQICTLRHSNSTTAKRQEVGRGLRICVDRYGVRQDKETLGEDVHKINKLTVIANESYADFTSALQRETREVLRDRAAVASIEYFSGKIIKSNEGERYEITERDASRIMVYLEDNEYIDDKGFLTPKYHADVAAESQVPYGTKLAPISEGVTMLIQSIYDPSVLKDMIVEEKQSAITNELNDNFYRDEFKRLWNEINHQYVYTVSYKSEELIENAILHLNAELTVKTLRYIKVEGQQTDDDVTEFGDTHSETEELTEVCTSTVPYDLVGDIARGARLTRRSVVKILQGLYPSKIALFKNNPEEFIRNVVRIIKEQKASMIVNHIHYQQTEGKYESDIFTATSRADFTKAYEAKKHVTNYVVSDSKGERDFAHDLDEANEVVVYAKLPRSFQIPTPVGNYAPDWAIAMERGGVKHIFFIAETKGSLLSMDITPIEKAKIDCCTHLFNEISTSKVKYYQVTKYQDLIDRMTEMK